VHIHGAPLIEPEGELVSLVGKDLNDTNSIQEPRKVVPRTETVSGLSTGFTREFPAYSISVLQLHSK
jgi:alpha-L-arabinofuranosidase